MDVRHARFVRSELDAAEAAEVGQVDALADELAEHLAAQSARIDVVHVHRAQSSAVQSIVADLLREQLGFRVLTRLGSFFGDPRREIDVVSLHVFGYGREA